MYKAINILKNMQQYQGKNILIKGSEKIFDIDFKIYGIPHLLGLHYTIPAEDRRNIKGQKIIKNIIKNNLSDIDILKKVRKYNNEKCVGDVKKRIETFDYFMKNLEHGIIVDKTLAGGNMDVNYLIIQKEPKDTVEEMVKNNNFLHLGILSGNNGALLENYMEINEKDKDILKTYFMEYGNTYFEKSKLFDSVKEILEYDEKLETYIPFSFDEKKREILIKEWKKEKDTEKFNYKEVLLQSKEINNRKRNIEIPKVTKEKEGNER